VRKWKEVIMNTVDINEIEMKGILKTKKINETKNWLFVKINKINKSLAKFTGHKR
jgi:hypothetical protein